jgi:integrase
MPEDRREHACRTAPVDGARAALEELPPRPDSPLVFPAPRGGYLDLRNFRNREWKPAQRELGIEPIRRVYDLRHSFATFALRAGVSTSTSPATWAPA